MPIQEKTFSISTHCDADDGCHHLRMTGQSCGPIHLVGYTAVNLYIIIKAAKSSSKRRNYQNKGCQSNFNSASWQICLLMQSLITSSQPTFSSTRLLLHSGHNKQTNKQLKVGQSIFSCLFFCSVCNSRHYLLHAIKFPALRQSYSSSPGFHEYRYVNRELPT